MGAQPRFGWIHLSDIHVGHGDATHIEDQRLVLGALRSDIELMLTSGVPRPNAIFVTGDIAFSGACRTSDEYTRAAQWLTAIAKAAGLGPDAVFVVPGNHDVQRTADRPVAAAALLSQLRAGNVSLDAALNDPDAHSRLKARQANYLAFAEGFAPACRTDAEAAGAQLYWKHFLEADNGLRLRLVGLNTALLAADESIFESDQRHLRLGTRQLSAAFMEPEVVPHEVVIVLSHHPLREQWLADETEAAGWIRKHAHLHLSGHVHEAGSERARGGGGTDFVSVAAGAVHGEKTVHGHPARHGYSFGALMADNGALKVRVWPRKWSSSNKDFRLDGDSVNPGSEHAEHDLPRVRLPGSYPASTSSAPTESGSGGMRAPATAGPPAISIARLPQGSSLFVGRTDEIAALDQAWSAKSTHIMTIVAWGGTGKSALVSEWLGRMATMEWGGAARVFGWSFYSQGARDDGAASADPFINTALSFFGDADPTKGSSWERGERLAALARQHRTLLILDGLEPLQEPEASGGRLRDPAIVALLRELAASMNGLCLITTRQPVGEVAEFGGKTVVRVDLDQLSMDDGARLLQLCGAEGAEQEFYEVVRAVKGHALTVTLLGHYIADALDKDVRRWREVPLGAAETRPSEHARHVMEAYDRWFGDGPERAILRIVGLFDRPVDEGCLAALRKEPAIEGVTDGLLVAQRDSLSRRLLQLFAGGKSSGQSRLPKQPLSEAQWKQVVSRLRRTGLLFPVGRSEDGSIDAHPLVRESFGQMLARENPQGFRAAHGRLYEHLRDTTPEFPDTLEGLQPLYQAVWHGCRAGQHEDAFRSVFYKRIRRGSEHYSTKKFGSFGTDLAAIAGFFEGAWTRPVATLSDRGQSFMLGEAAYALRALGRLREAVAPSKAALDIYIAQMDWENADTEAVNLAQLHAALGALREAQSIVEQANEFADRAGDSFAQENTASTHGTILHALGRREAARALFEKAEQKCIARRANSMPLPMGSVAGYWFCALLLDLGEAQEVERRAYQTLGWLKYVPLETALDHLSLGCALAMREQREDARRRFTLAIDGLRDARHLWLLAPALLMRAAFFREANDHESARRDLDEAFGLARRCELRLVECDAHLEQARLALATNDLAAARTAFAAARTLVDQCSYHRRDCELLLLEARLALASGDYPKAVAACERARAIIGAEKLRVYDKELAAVELAVIRGMPPS